MKNRTNGLVAQVLVVVAILLACLGGTKAVYGQTLTAADFQCFLDRWASQDPYANCDGVGGLTANDFQCFVNRFAAGDAWANCDGSSKSEGWTDLTPPAGAQVFYVAASGSDSNPGTQAAPFRSPGRGLAALRDGMPDQVLLRCGDTWSEGQLNITKGCNTAGQYQVIGSYGKGPRPRLSFAATGFRGESLGKRRLALVGLEIVGTQTQGTSGIILLGWRDILIEDCAVRGFADNVVIQGFGIRTTGVRVRRNVIADAFYPPTQFDPNGNPVSRALGLYMDTTDDWSIEENVFDRCGITGSIFGRPVYVQSDCSRGAFRGNVMARSCAEGVQVRPGGIVHNNLSLRNPIGIFVGDAQPGLNQVTSNVVIESGDINPNDRRGIGIHANGRSIITGNVLGYNTGTGWGAVKALYLNGASVELAGNYVWNWTRDPALGGPGDVHESHGIHIEGGPAGEALEISANTILQVRPGIVAARLNSSLAIGGAGNRYHQNPATAYPPLIGTPLGQWASIAAPPDPRFRITDMTGLTLEAWLAEARKQSRQNWREPYTAASVNEQVRARVGL